MTGRVPAYWAFVFTSPRELAHAFLCDSLEVASQVAVALSSWESAPPPSPGPLLFLAGRADAQGCLLRVVSAIGFDGGWHEASCAATETCALLLGLGIDFTTPAARGKVVR